MSHATCVRIEARGVNASAVLAANRFEIANHPRAHAARDGR
jgi:hypothetical protein